MYNVPAEHLFLHTETSSSELQHHCLEFVILHLFLHALTWNEITKHVKLSMRLLFLSCSLIIMSQFCNLKNKGGFIKYLVGGGGSRPTPKLFVFFFWPPSKSDCDELSDMVYFQPKLLMPPCTFLISSVQIPNPPPPPKANCRKPMPPTSKCVWPPPPHHIKTYKNKYHLEQPHAMLLHAHDSLWLVTWNLAITVTFK